MTTDDGVLLFLGMLAVLCQVFVVVLVLTGASALSAPALRVRRRAVLRALAPVSAWFAFAVALVTTSGSLYLSEIKGYEPCHLCWVQRCFLYPQVVFTLLLALRPQWVWVRRLSIAFVLMCLPVSAYHVLLEFYPTLETSSCTFDNPCSQRFVFLFNYMGTPLMAATSAATIFSLVSIQRALPLREVLYWVVVALGEVAIVLYGSSSLLNIVPLPVVAFVVQVFLDRRRRASIPADVSN